LQREVTTLRGVLVEPARPMVVVLGGGKAADKIGVVSRFLGIADWVLLGGGMSYPFLAASGRRVGRSLCDQLSVVAANEMLMRPDAYATLQLPLDLVLADRPSPDAKVWVSDSLDLEDAWEANDIGPRTRQLYASIIAGAGTVIWNGPVGAHARQPFAAGTHAIADAVASTAAVTVVGGGSSTAVLRSYGLENDVTYISTGGGAALEYMAGLELPGVAALVGDADSCAAERRVRVGPRSIIDRHADETWRSPTTARQPNHLQQATRAFETSQVTTRPQCARPATTPA